MQQDIVLDFDQFDKPQNNENIAMVVANNDVADILDGVSDMDIKDIRVASISADDVSGYIDAGDITLDISHQIIVDDM